MSQGLSIMYGFIAFILLIFGTLTNSTPHTVYGVALMMLSIFEEYKALKWEE